MKINILFIVMMLTSTAAFAHGENELGPNNGYIRMPGPYHTELVPETDGNFMVYLLDVNNQNPTTKDSSVEFKVSDAKGSVSFKCLPMDIHFHCVNDKKIENPKTGKGAKIILKTTRLGKKSSEAVYELPLSLQAAPALDHSKMKH